MSSTEIIYSIGHLFQWSFGFFEVVGNYFNTFLILLGFGGFFFWMNTQRKFNEKANVPVDVKENAGWYKNGSDKRLK